MDVSRDSCFLILWVVEIYILYIVVRAIDWPCEGPHFLKSDLVRVIEEIGIVKVPSSMGLSLPIILERNPGVLSAVVFYQIWLSHLLTSDHRCFFYIIVSLDVGSIESSHLMTVETFVILMFVFNSADPTTARTLFAANHHFDHVDEFGIVLLVELRNSA